MGCKKVYEYGGNTFGFGSRSVLGAGWPKDPIKENYIKHLDLVTNKFFEIYL